MQIIAGHFKGRKITPPKGDLTRPTSSRLREALFNICQRDIEDSSFLDLFAGSGAMGFEALSRGAHQATFVDLSRESIKCIKSNTSLLKVDSQSKVFFGDVFDWIEKLAKMGVSFDIIYADPPYDQIKEFKGANLSYSEYILMLIDENPSILSSKGFLFLEDAPGSIPKEKSLKNLILKSSRKMGKSALNQYILR